MTKKSLLVMDEEANLGATRLFRREVRSVMEECGASEEICDRLLLGLSEIVANVVRHAEPPSPTVGVELTRSHRTWIVEVTDSGGPFLDIEAKFEKSEAIDNRPAESGMGLQLIRHSVDAWEYLPGVEEHPNRFRIAVSANSRQSANGQSVLLVDDDPTLREVVRNYLKDEYCVYTAASVSEALTIVEQEKIDVILSDVVMPAADGFELRRRLRRKMSLGTLPFIFMTGRDEPDLSRKAGNLGVDDFLAKPLSKQNLLQVLERVLKRSSDLSALHGRRLDEDVTKALSPSLPKRLSGFDCHVRFSTADAGGGDMLMCRVFQDRSLVFLADVMGHGEQAKFHAHALWGYVTGLLQSADAPPSPGDLLSSISEGMAQGMVLSESLATIVLLELGSDGRCTIATGGHPPPFLIDNRRARKLDVSGPLPGLLPEYSYCETRFDMSPGQDLVIYTDGILQGLDADEDELANLLTSKIGGPVRTLDSIFLHLNERNHISTDDATVAMIGYRP